MKKLVLIFLYITACNSKPVKRYGMIIYSVCSVKINLMKKLVLIFLCITACNTKAVKRYGMITGLQRDKVAYYKQLHAAVWPDVLKTISASNIHNYSIYLHKIGEQYYLFSYFEYTGNDFELDMKKMAADSTTQRWWKETAPTQIPLPEATAAKQT
jgi:L-rhamnose mutarotase